MLNKVTVTVSGPYTLNPESVAGQHLVEIDAAIRAKLQGVAIELLEADQGMAARAVLELCIQINAAVLVIMGDCKAEN